METPPPNDSFKASLSPPVGGRLHSFRRDWQTNKCSSNMLNIITNGYVLPFLSKPNLVRFPLIQSEYKALLQLPDPSTQASPKVEASHRPKQVQHFSTHRKVQNGNSRVHQDLPDSRGMGIIDRPVGRLPSQSHPPKLKEIPNVGVPPHD